MTKAEAVANFVEHVLPHVPYNDVPALNEAWNNYTDTLCKNGDITSHQYNTWTHPHISKRMWESAVMDRKSVEYFS